MQVALAARGLMGSMVAHLRSSGASDEIDFG
jgi:hypothetical protein